jgi:hypothetical protein
MPMLKTNQRFMTAKELINRWRISELDLIEILHGNELHFIDSDTLCSYCYDEKVLRVKFIDKMAFALVDVERYEEKHPEYKPDVEPEPLNGKERRELGQLRDEKKKWDLSLKAAVQIGIFCSNKPDASVTKAMVQDILNNEFGQLPSTTINKIWKAVPDKFTKKAGRPKKDTQNQA